MTTSNLVGPSPTFSLPEAARGASTIAAALFVATLSLHFLPGVVLGVLLGARILMSDAKGPSTPDIRVERTRSINFLQEAFLGGFGACMFVFGAAMMLAPAIELLAPPEGPAAGVFEAVFGLVLLVMGFFMCCWRPQFVLDRPSNRITRYPFGRSVPVMAKELPYGELAVFADGAPSRGYLIVRGAVGKYTMELMHRRGGVFGTGESFGAVEAQAWADALGARVWTIEDAMKAGAV